MSKGTFFRNRENSNRKIFEIDENLKIVVDKIKGFALIKKIDDTSGFVYITDYLDIIFIKPLSSLLGAIIRKIEVCKLNTNNNLFYTDFDNTKFITIINKKEYCIKIKSNFTTKEFNLQFIFNDDIIFIMDYIVNQIQINLFLNVLNTIKEEYVDGSI